MMSPSKRWSKRRSKRPFKRPFKRPSKKPSKKPSKRSEYIDTGKLKHEHWLYKQQTTSVIKFKKDITKSSCAVCRRRLEDPNFPEETFKCSRCPDFNICKSCFNRQNYPGQQNSRKISSSDMKLVSEKVCLPSECRCFKCRIKIEIKLGSIAFFDVDELIKRKFSFIACCRCIVGPTNGPEGMKEAPKRNTELADQPRQGAAANDDGPMLVYDPHGLLEPDRFPQRGIRQRELVVQGNAELAAQPRQEAATYDDGPMLVYDPHGLLEPDRFPQRGIRQRELVVQGNAELADQPRQEAAADAQGPTNGPEGIQVAPQRNTELANQPRQGAAANA
ncbi:uncharacterized protein [Pocillopora verrucosa]|uniref:uncharacterized protein n=1 Tax=Pocillopora verrucosa TaxID=203993 RepID=UPI00333EE93B